MVSKSTGSLVFIDSSLEQYEHLLDGVVAGAEVVLVDAQRDGVEQITQVLQERRDIQSLHVLSHAAPGVLQLGAARVTAASLSQYAPSIRQWARALAANAEVLLYGCRLAANDAGRSLVTQLAQLTQAAIAASETLTGHSSQGGDWNLSVRTGPIAAPLALRPETLATYPSVLALFDWSSPDIDWPDGESGTTVFRNVDGTGVDFTIDISGTNGVTFGQAPSGVGPLTPDDIQFLQGGETTIPTALHITMDNATRQDAVTTTVSFSQALRGIAFRIFDIDEGLATTGWQDEVEIIGFRGNTVVQPRLIASNNAAYDINGNVAVGVRNAVNTGVESNEGVLSVVFDSRITSYQVIYRNGPDAIANPGEQGIGILSNIFFNEPNGGTNRAPDTDDVRLRVDPGATRRIPGLAGTDPDGTVERFRITSLPAAAQGTLFFGNPDRGGEQIEEGDRIRANQINRVFFQADNDFTGTTFEYASIDNEGLEDPTPGVVRLRPGGGSGDPDNQRPDTRDVLNRVDADSVKGLRRLGGSDPDGTVEQFRIISLPRARQGSLFLGNPDRGGAAVEEGQDIPAGQINRLFFQSTAGFTGTRFQYAAIDNEGAIDRSPATVELRPTRTPSDNRPPDTVPFATLASPDTVTRLTGFAVSDPDGDDTVESFTILRLPPQRFGSLFIGDPGRGGTPVVAGEAIDVDQLNQIFLSTTEDFVAGDENIAIQFRYTATDNQGASDRTPARVTVSPGGGSQPNDRCRRGETLIGTRQNDRLSGGDGRDRIFGNAGNDQLRGRGCDDLINGGQGNDTMLGDAGNDTLDGGAGADSADGGAGQDLLFGGADNDRLSGGRGDDIVRGGQGRDRISGGTGSDELSGRSDDDQISGDDGNDVIVGGRGDDRLQGGDGNDRIDAKSGDDRVRGDKGNDRVSGGKGDDTITGRLGSDRISAGAGADRVDGSAGADRIRGELGDDFIQGGGGADRLKGNIGDDRVRAGKGKDIVNGGQDNDFLSGRNGADRLRGSSGDDRLRGNGLSDLLIGNRGEDRLNAGTGDDELIGGLGADILVGGRGGDLFVYRTVRDGDDRGDRIRRFEAGQDLIDLSKLLNKRQFSADGAFRRYVSLSQSRGSTLLEINIDGDTGENFKPFATIKGVEPSEIGRSSFIV